MHNYSESAEQLAESTQRDLAAILQDGMIDERELKLIQGHLGQYESLEMDVADLLAEMQDVFPKVRDVEDKRALEEANLAVRQLEHAVSAVSHLLEMLIHNPADPPPPAAILRLLGNGGGHLRWKVLLRQGGA
jgi:hypothetical protein